MKLFRSLLLIGIVAALISSCQKEMSEENGNTPTDPLDSNTVLLKKYIRLDTTLSSPNDTVFTAAYTYDNAGRVTNIFYKYFDHPNALYEGTVDERIYYNGTDTNMAYRTLTNVNSSGTETEAEYFTYDATGRVLKDSVVSVNNDATFHYRYAGNVIHAAVYFAPDFSDTVFYTTHHIQTTNSNIVMERDSCYEVMNNWPWGIPGVASTDATYDSHPNPLYRVSPPWPVIFEIEHIFYPGIVNQKNNVTHSYQEFDGWGPGESDEWTFTYTYLPNGYPSMARIANAWSAGGETYYYKDIFQYY